MGSIFSILAIVWLFCFLAELILYKIEKSAWNRRLAPELKNKTGNSFLMFIPMYIAAPLVLGLHVHQLIRDGGFAKSNNNGK